MAHSTSRGCRGCAHFGGSTAEREARLDLAYGGMRRSQLRVGEWRKSSHSNPSGNCVETARLPSGWVAVRDSKDPGGPVLVFTRRQWAAFLRTVRPPSCERLGRLPANGEAAFLLT